MKETMLARIGLEISSSDEQKPAAVVDYHAYMENPAAVHALLGQFASSYVKGEKPAWTTDGSANESLLGLAPDNMEVMFRTLQRVLQKLQVFSSMHAKLGPNNKISRNELARMNDSGLSGYSDVTLDMFYDVACLSSIITITGYRNDGAPDHELLKRLGGIAIELPANVKQLLSDLHNGKVMKEADMWTFGSSKTTQNANVPTADFLMQNINPGFQLSFVSRHQAAIHDLEDEVRKSSNDVKGYASDGESMLLANLIHTDGMNKPECHTIFNLPCDRKTFSAFTPVSKNGSIHYVWEKEGKEPEKGTPIHVPFGMLLTLPPDCKLSEANAFDGGMDIMASRDSKIFNLELWFTGTKEGIPKTMDFQFSPPDLSHPYADHKMFHANHAIFSCIFHHPGIAPAESCPFTHAAGLGNSSPIPSAAGMSEVGSFSPTVFPDIGLKRPEQDEAGGRERKKARVFQKRNLDYLKSQVPTMAVVLKHPKITETNFWNIQFQDVRGAGLLFQELTGTEDHGPPPTPEDALDAISTYRLFLHLVKEEKDFRYQKLLASEVVVKVWKLHVNHSSYEQDCMELLGERFILRYRIHADMLCEESLIRASETAASLRLHLTEAMRDYVDDTIMGKLLAFKPHGVRWHGGDVDLADDEALESHPGDASSDDVTEPSANPK